MLDPAIKQFWVVVNGNFTPDRLYLTEQDAENYRNTKKESGYIILLNFNKSMNLPFASTLLNKKRYKPEDRHLIIDINQELVETVLKIMYDQAYRGVWIPRNKLNELSRIWSEDDYFSDPNFFDESPSMRDTIVKKNKNFEVFWQLFDRDEVFKADLDVDEKDIWCYKCKLIHRPEGLVYVRKKDTTVLDNFINSSLP